MELICASEIKESKIFIRKLVKFHFFKKNEYEDVEFTSKRDCSNVIVESPILELGKKIPYVKIGDYEIWGLLPIERIADNGFECSVDYYKVNQTLSD